MITRQPVPHAPRSPFAGHLSLVLALLWPLICSAQLSDDFTSDSALNTSRWTSTSGLLTGLASKYNSTLITPTLSFSGAGMNFSGVNRSNVLAGVQSFAAFQPPFTVTTTVSASQAHGNAYVVFLASADLTQWLAMSGNLNPGNGSYFGVWVNYNNSGLPFLSLGNELYSDPSTNSPYTIQIYVNDTGRATVSLFSPNGQLLGMQSLLQLGSGPFQIILGQREGGPITPGANVATWKNASVTSLAPAPILAPITWTNRVPHLTWSTVLGATYQAQFTTALPPAQWTNLGSSITATTSTTTIADAPTSDPQRFYRVVLLH